jgi:hypothetical protein
VSVDQPTTYSFLYRPDDTDAFVTGNSSFVEIKEGGGAYDIAATWYVSTSVGTTKRWRVNDGDGIGGYSWIDSGLELIADSTYAFTIECYPATQSYDITIDNLQDASPAFTATDLWWFDASHSKPAGRLVFTHQVDGTLATRTYGYSLDSIVISAVPEPASLSLLAAAALLWPRRRRA